MKHKYSYRISPYAKMNKRYGGYSFNFKPLTFYSLKSKLDQNESFIFFLGAPWCKNCRAIMPILNEVVNEMGKTIYVMDPRPYRQKTKQSDIRKQLTKETEKMMKYISSHLNIDLLKNTNDTYQLSIPFLTVFENGVARSYFNKEYVSSDITDELKKELKKVFTTLLNSTT